MHDVEVPGRARSARSARTLNVSGSGNAPPHIMATSSTSAQSRYSRQRGVRNGSSSRYRSRLGSRRQQRPGVELRVGLAGEHLDVVPERGELPAQVADVDALAAGVRLAAVGQQRDAQRAVGRYHGLISRDGLVPMLAPNTVKSYGDSLASPHAVPAQPGAIRRSSPAIHPAVVFEPRAGTADRTFRAHPAGRAERAPDGGGPVATISAAPLPWSNVTRRESSSAAAHSY